MILAIQDEPTDLKCFLVFFSPWVLENFDDCSYDML